MLSINTNLHKVAIRYAKYLNISVTATTLVQQLEENPYYPKLYSLCGVFDQFNISNDLYTGTKDDLMGFKPPYITRLYNEHIENYFVLVTDMNAAEVSYLAEGKELNKITTEVFFKKWLNVIFVGEKSNLSGESNYAGKLKEQKNKKAKKNLLVSGGVAMLIFSCLLLLINNPGISLLNIGSILTIKLIGVAITILLLIYEIDKTNTFVKNICTAGKKVNCDKVLNSNASKLFGMGWNEIGFFYFAATLLFLFFPGITFAAKTLYLAIVNIVAAPYMLFSIYYQWKIIKQWCVLCIITQIVLLIELIWSIENFWMHDKNINGLLSLTEISTLVICILLPIVTWYFIKPSLIKAKNPDHYSNAYKRLKYNPQVFSSLLKEQASAPDGWESIGITLGNTDASTKIIMISDPFCSACAHAHFIFKQLLKQNENIVLKIIFSTLNDENDESTIVVKHFLSVAGKNNPMEIEMALNEWYAASKSKTDQKNLIAKYTTNEIPGQNMDMINIMNEWCEEVKIPYLPYIFINGNCLPEIYDVDEVKNILMYYNN